MTSARNGSLVRTLAVLALGVVLLVVAGAIRKASLADDGGYTTRAVTDEVNSAIMRSRADNAPTWMDARERLRVEVHLLAEEPYIAYAWLVRAKGRGLVSYSSGGVAEQGDEIVPLSGPIGDAAINSAAWLTAGVERYVPLTIAAMSSDGDHTDVFRYMAVPITFENGDGAIVGVVYDRSQSSGNPGFLYILSLLGGVGCLLGAAYLAIMPMIRRGPA